jgi:hypothetical protein
MEGIQLWNSSPCWLISLFNSSSFLLTFTLSAAKNLFTDFTLVWLLKICFRKWNGLNKWNCLYCCINCYCREGKSKKFSSFLDCFAHIIYQLIKNETMDLEILVLSTICHSDHEPWITTFKNLEERSYSYKLIELISNFPLVWQLGNLLMSWSF